VSQTVAIELKIGGDISEYGNEQALSSGPDSVAEGKNKVFHCRHSFIVD
jgi:hypothetical protein